MRKPILAAFAVLIIGTIVLPGCFYYVGPGWYPDRDEGWERHREWRERHGALTPPPDDQHKRDDYARRGHGDKTAG